MKKIPQRRTDSEAVQVGDYYDGQKRYYDQINEQTVVKVLSGDCYVTAGQDELLVTILGSCISACVRDPVTRIGGMNHFLLPGSDSAAESARFGAFAMEQLINEILKLGGKKDRLEAKIFGGANVIKSSALIGTKNIAFVKKFLQDEHIKIHGEDVGGGSPRRLHYYPETGKVMLRKLQRKEDDALVIKEETEYEKSIHKPKHSPEEDLELF